MFGWEFPPFSSGGLGTACYGLTKSLSKKGVDLTFVIPNAGNAPKPEFIKLISAGDIGNIKIRRIKSLLMPYLTSQGYDELLMKKANKNNIYGPTLFEEVYRYTQAAARIAKQESFDVIHCHDWMTYGAGIKAKEITKKPLVIHVHATEFDRTGGNGVNEYVYSLEKEGMENANRIIAVSNFTKNKIAYHYNINPEKISVVHNGVEFNENRFDNCLFDGIKRYDKVVLFLGRITLQKGPDYFLYAAKKVLEQEKNVKFIIAGSGDMEPFIIEKAVELGIGDKFLFAGFLKGDEIDKAYQMADVYVMPSVSEPFGITPLEAMKNNTPVIISKQSGVSEVIKNCLIVDFWDVNEMANKILAVLRYKALSECLKDDGLNEVKKINWDRPAEKCIDIYNKVLMGSL